MRNRVCRCRQEPRPTIHDFINEAIRQVREGGETINTVTERLGLRPALMRQWLSAQQPDEIGRPDNEMIDTLKQENDALRRECRHLREMILSMSLIQRGPSGSR